MVVIGIGRGDSSAADSGGEGGGAGGPLEVVGVVLGFHGGGE